MTVTFSGLASGVDTASVVESLIEIESAPITTMEEEQEYLEVKRDAYNELNTLLESFNSAVAALNSDTDLNSFEVSDSGSDYFSISTSSICEEGSYAIEVVSLAQRQKDISEQGYSDSDETTLSGTFDIGGETIEYDGVTLSELVEIINDEGYGISASIVNDGTDAGYRLLLTAENAGEEIEITATGSIEIDTGTEGHMVQAAQAHVVIDSVDYYSSTNTITTAIKGATINLVDISTAGASNITITSKTEDVISTQLAEMVSAYNSIEEYIDTIYESDSTLANSMKSVLRGIKSYLSHSSIVSLGVTSDWETGQLSFDSEKLSEVYAQDSEAVIEALIGGDDSEGVMTWLDEYMTMQMDSSSGFLATKESSIDSQISRLDVSIENMQTRLEKRQETLEAQFTAMETLISTLNSQADFLTAFFENYSSS